MIGGDILNQKYSLIEILLFFFATVSFGQIDYTTQVQPIFNNHCIDCHISVHGSGALELESYEYLMHGDSNNGPVVIPFNADSSLLYKVLLRDSVIVPNEPICCRMPKNADPLTLEQQTIIYNWINEGALGPTVSVNNQGLKNPFFLRAYPNPFNNRIEISYQLIDKQLAVIKIFDILGNNIKTIKNKNQNLEWSSVTWDATNNTGAPVSGGIYLVSLQTNGMLQKLQKIVYVK
jgi:hypothetical protein